MHATNRFLIICLALTALTALAVAEGAAEKDCSQLLPEARTALETATNAFNKLGEEGAEAHATRYEAESNCELAMGNCDVALELYEEDCGKEAEDIITKASSLYFWIHRTAPISFFEWKNKEKGIKDDEMFGSDDYAEQTKKNRDEGTPEETAPSGHESTEEETADTEPKEVKPVAAKPAAEDPCKKLEIAQNVEKQEPFDAVVAYSELASQFPDHECGKKAMARIAEIMNSGSPSDQPSLGKIVSSLKSGLGSKDEADQIRAIRQAHNMKAIAVVVPLVDALRKEPEDSKIATYLLAALRTTNRRETCFQLGDVKKGGLKRFPDKQPKRQLEVIDCLADIGGPRGALALGSFLDSKNKPTLDRVFAKLEAIGIDGGLGLAVGLQLLLGNGNPANVNQCLDLMGKLQHPACVSAILAGGKGLLSTKQKGNPYFEKCVGDQREMYWDGGDGGILAKIGWNGIWVLIDEGMGGSDPRTRTFSQYAARKITGWSLGMSDGPWREKFRSEVASGVRPLPYGMKKIP